MSFPRYPAYKDSGVEWLGEVPAHWRVDRFKRSTRGFKHGIWGDDPREDGTGIACVRVADFDRQKLRVEWSGEPTIRSIRERELEGRLLRPGDLLLERSGGGDAQPVGCVVLHDDARPAVCSNFVTRVEVAPGMDASFWRYQHAAAYAVRLTTRSIKQTSGIQNLDPQQYLDERAVFPPLDEQSAIAAFLDRETAKLDLLVAEQQRLIELLKEKRQAVISHAVTRGLNPGGPTKPSGVEWLGEVPAHWEVKKLKHVSPELTVGIVLEPSKLYAKEGVPALRSLNVRPGAITLENLVFITQAGHELHSKSKLRAGDIVAVRSGHPGTAAVIPRELDGCNCIDLLVIRKPPVGSERFLCWYLASDSARVQFSVGTGGAIQQHFNLGTAAELIVAVPPPAEQLRIVAFLDEATAELDGLTAESQRVIELLLERRTVLIFAAVTGQLDVRARANGTVEDKTAA